MSLRQRIARILPKPAPDEAPAMPSAISPEGSDFQRRAHIMERIQERLRQIPPNDVPIPFAVVERWDKHKTPNGDAVEKVTRFSPGTRHGHVQIDTANGLSTDIIATLINEPRLEGFRIEDALFLYIEATGLSHGAGTFAFVVGFGRFEADGTFIVRQLVLEDPKHELAFLHRFKSLLESAPYLISFNGKSYDLSVMQTRLIVHRLYSPTESEIKLTPHLDLLHIHRALWKNILPNCRLQTLEQEVLGFRREDDIPGEMVPSLYFHYLQTTDARALIPVLEHNEIDIVSMAGLVANLLNEVHHPNEIVRNELLAMLGQLHVKRGLLHRGIQLLEKALENPLEPDTLRAAFRASIKAHKQLGKHSRLYPILQEFADAFPADIAAWNELAMHYEHRMKNYTKALDCAERAEALLPQWQTPEHEQIARRIRRLKRWKAKNEKGPESN